MKVAQEWRQVAQMLLASMFVLMLAAGCRRPEPDMLVSPIDPGAVQRGAVLVEGLAACSFCHGLVPEPASPMSGGGIWLDKYGLVQASNITPSKSGIGEWTTNEIVTAIRHSLRPGGEMLSTEVHNGYEWMADEDVLAIVAYLRSQAPIDNEVPTREVPFIDRNTTGFFDRAPQVAGFIPTIEPRFKTEYGRYLTLHVARCQGCHNGPVTIVAEEGNFLQGGRQIQTSAGEIVSPGIGPNQIDGLGSWSEKDIVHYLRTGNTPEGRVVDPDFCPIRFYQAASDQDVQAIAHFLKSLPPEI